MLIAYATAEGKLASDRGRSLWTALRPASRPASASACSGRHQRPRSECATTACIRRSSDSLGSRITASKCSSGMSARDGVMCVRRAGKGFNQRETTALRFMRRASGPPCWKAQFSRCRVPSGKCGQRLEDLDPSTCPKQAPSELVRHAASGRVDLHR